MSSSQASPSNINPINPGADDGANSRTTRLAELLRLQMELYTVGLVERSLIIQIAELETELGIAAAKQNK